MAASDPSISVVIPTHLRPGFLAQALDSVSRQSRHPLEVIVVSDVADQETADTVESAALPATFVGPETGRMGASASRNRGLSLARGDWVAFLDDDDLWLPEYLHHAMTAIDRADVDAIVFWMDMFHEASSKPGSRTPEGLTPSQVVASGAGVTGTNLVVRRDFAARIGGYDEDLRMRNDTDFFFRFLKAGGRYAVVDLPLARQRKHGEGQLTGHSIRRAEATEAYARKHAADLSWRDRRQLAFVAHRIRANAESTPALRAWHRGLALLCYSPRQFLLDRRNRRYSNFYTVPSMQGPDSK